jgi:hypothetical protein
MENLGIFYDHLVYFMYSHRKYCMAIWCILLSFGLFSPRFSILYQEKSGNPECAKMNMGVIWGTFSTVLDDYFHKSHLDTLLRSCPKVCRTMTSLIRLFTGYRVAKTSFL